MSLQSESGVHMSQMGVPPTHATGEGPQDGGQQAYRARKSKLQLWNDLKISGE
jgi:peroxin-3